MTKRYRWLTPPSLPDDRVCRTLYIPNSQQWIGAVTGALLPLTYAWAWEQNEPTDLTPEAAAAAALVMLERLFETGSQCMIGQIVASLIPNLPTPPVGFLYLDGATYNRVDYPDLYAVIDPVYRLDADTFVVPDFRNKMPLGVDRFGVNGPVTNPNAVGGNRETTLLTQNLPAHAHNYKEFTVISVRNPATGTNYNAASNSSQQPTGNVGSNIPFSNMPPYVAVYWYVVAR